ncbi:DUF2651 family protein [Alkalihalobacillus hemicellulosilyticus]|uniref:DUF2651 family protein n=1 Tax=Halalkalibacter hemicellulosilyticus TaxID=127886 RepID=UPI0005511A1A|nr:DUF2651 family protein [Halalkalibacter hemicellulosilyticus]
MEFISILVVYPIILILASIIGYILLHKWMVMPILTFIVFTILTFTIFNPSFYVWVLIYTLLSLLVSLIMKKVKA